MPLSHRNDDHFGLFSPNTCTHRARDHTMCAVWYFSTDSFFKKDFIYLILVKGVGREKKRKRNINVREKHQSVASRVHHNQGPNPQPRHVPRPGIEPATFCFAGRGPAN